MSKPFRTAQNTYRCRSCCSSIQYMQRYGVVAEGRGSFAERFCGTVSVCLCRDSCFDKQMTLVPTKLLLYQETEARAKKGWREPNNRIPNADFRGSFAQGARKGSLPSRTRCRLLDHQLVLSPLTGHCGLSRLGICFCVMSSRREHEWGPHRVICSTAHDVCKP